MHILLNIIKVLTDVFYLFVLAYYIKVAHSKEHVYIYVCLLKEDGSKIC